MLEGERLLGAKKAADMLDISVKQLGRLVLWGHLPKPKMIGDERRWYLSDLHDYMFRLKHDLLPPIPKPKRRTKSDKGSGQTPQD